MFQILGIQVERHLTEEEVQEINFIIKSRSLRFVAGGKEEWLYPEKQVSKANWANFGGGYLLMPDPRSVSFTKEILMGFNDGSATGFDSYGRRPWDAEYKVPGGPDEWYTFNKFKAEFANQFGPRRRGRAYQMGRLDPETDSDYLHKAHLNFGRRR